MLSIHFIEAWLNLFNKLDARFNYFESFVALKQKSFVALMLSLVSVVFVCHFFPSLCLPFEFMLCRNTNSKLLHLLLGEKKRETEKRKIVNASKEMKYIYYSCYYLLKLLTFWYPLHLLSWCGCQIVNMCFLEPLNVTGVELIALHLEVSMDLVASDSKSNRSCILIAQRSWDLVEIVILVALKMP